MVVVNDPDLSWAVSKALSIVVSTFAVVASLAWFAARKPFSK